MRAGKRFYRCTLTKGREREALQDIRNGGMSAVLALTQAIAIVYPDIATELLQNIVAGQSYDRIERRRGYVPLNRADFYGCRRKVLSLYAKMRGIGE